jgi:hypothetical protein
MNTTEEWSALETFARWAFGPHGSPMLELLACGDFTEGYAYHQPNELFCRALKEVEVRRNIFSIPFGYHKSELGYIKVLHGSDTDVPMAILSAHPAYNEIPWLSAMPFFSSDVA